MAGKKKSSNPKAQDKPTSSPPAEAFADDTTGSQENKVFSETLADNTTSSQANKTFTDDPIQGNFEGPPTKDPGSSYLTGSDPEISGDGTDVIRSDGYLEPHREYFGQRFAHFKRWVRDIELSEGGMDKFTRGYESFGLHVTPEGVRYREWAPGAKEASLVGDFNGWDVGANPMARNAFGVWETVVPNAGDGSVAIPHGSHIKVTFVTGSGERVYRLPAWSRYVTQDLAKSPIYEA
ncbi:alpha-1,4-glucan branching enzyme, partial [Coemansia sp. RSA 2618]